jgi:hypothetical protein
MKNVLYFKGLFIILSSIFLILQYSDSNRMSLIAGGLVSVGLSLNIIGFFHKQKVEKH